MARSPELKRTPLTDVHEALGAKMVDFAGWYMPIQYTGVIEEHHAVRRAAGLFDLSHMGELWVTGSEAQSALQRLLTNDLSTLSPGKAQYTFLLNERGGIIDDLLVYAESPTSYWMVVNASNTAKVQAWLSERLSGDAHVEDRSAEITLLAIQGPHAERILQPHVAADLAQLPPFSYAPMQLAGGEVLVSRTGYTGEDGFELFLPAERSDEVWERLMTTGAPEGLLPVGLGARDTLRLEARLPLYGNELNEETTPLEAGLQAFVKLDKGDFCGRKALIEQQTIGIPRRLRGFMMQERAVARKGYSIYASEEIEEIAEIKDENRKRVGHVTSGTFSPTLQQNIGLGYVATGYGEVGADLWIDVRGRFKRAQIVKGRFISASSN